MCAYRHACVCVRESECVRICVRADRVGGVEEKNHYLHIYEVPLHPIPCHCID